MYNYILLCHFVPFSCNLCEFISLYLVMVSHSTLLWIISPRDIANINFSTISSSLKKKRDFISSISQFYKMPSIVRNGKDFNSS